MRRTYLLPFLAFCVGLLQAYLMGSAYETSFDLKMWSPDTRFFTLCASFVLGNGGATFVWAYRRQL